MRTVCRLFAMDAWVAEQKQQKRRHRRGSVRRFAGKRSLPSGCAGVPGDGRADRRRRADAGTKRAALQDPVVVKDGRPAGAGLSRDAGRADRPWTSCTRAWAELERRSVGAANVGILVHGDNHFIVRGLCRTVSRLGAGAALVDYPDRRGEAEELSKWRIVPAISRGSELGDRGAGRW